MDNNFLLTYSYENDEGRTDANYSWYESEEEMNDDIQFMKNTLHDFRINEAMEIMQVRNINT